MMRASTQVGTYASESQRSLTRAIAAALERGRLARWEAAAFAAIAMLVGALVYGPHVEHGNFMLDDWAFAAEYQRLGFLHMISGLLDPSEALMNVGGRPLAALYYASTSAAFGTHPALHLAWIALLGVLMSLLVFLLLRELRVERVHAGAIAILLLVFPAADAPRLFAAGGQSQLAIAMCLAGFVLALRALRTTGPRAWALHGVSLACFAISILQYEIAVGAVGLSVLLYRTQVRWRPSLVRWVADLVVLLPLLLYYRLNKPYGVQTPSEQVDRVREIQGQARTLLSRAGIQDGRHLLPLPLVALLIAVAAIAMWRLPKDDRIRGDLRRWLALFIGGGIATGAGYVSFVAADGFYVPLRPGIGNRTNIAAAAGYVIVLYALAVLVGLLAGRLLVAARAKIDPRRCAAVTALSAAAVLGTLWALKVADHRAAYDRAAGIDREVVRALRAVPKPAPGSTVYTFGVPGSAAPLVFAFTSSWDLTGAERLVWKDPTYQGVPSPSLESDFPGNSPRDSGITCARNGVTPHGGMYKDRAPAPYGAVVFVDVPEQTATLVRDTSTCTTAVARLFARG